MQSGYAWFVTQSHLGWHSYDKTWFVIDVTIWNQAKGEAADSRMRTITHHLLQLLACVCPCVREGLWFVSGYLIHLTCDSIMAKLRYRSSEEKRKSSVNGKSTTKIEYLSAKSNAAPNLIVKNTSPRSVTTH
jgi:hypothetical protein